MFDMTAGIINQTIHTIVDNNTNTRKDREKDSRSEIQLITTEAKGELNWVQNPNNSERERERTKKKKRRTGERKEP